MWYLCIHIACAVLANTIYYVIEGHKEDFDDITFIMCMSSIFAPIALIVLMSYALGMYVRDQIESSTAESEPLNLKRKQ